MKKMKYNKLFWLLHICGWGLLFFLNSGSKYLYVTTLKPQYIFFEGLITYSLGFIFTLSLRYYLKYQIDFESFKKADVLKILIAYVFAGFVYSLGMLLPFPLYTYYHNDAVILSAQLIAGNAINAYLFILYWLILYVSIKKYLTLKAVQQNQPALKRELKISQLNTLKGQINPHFMFNCLNNIRALMLEDVAKAREMITRLSELLRYSLGHNDQDKVKLHEELEVVENTIALSKIQFEDRLNFMQEVDQSLLDQMVPPMIIQMLIENALKHGIAHQQKGGEVFLKISDEDQTIIIQVINSGRLVQQKEGTQIGIKNIHKRLNLIYKNRASFDLKQQQGKVYATIVVPQQ